jgi:hypothetical protein
MSWVVDTCLLVDIASGDPVFAKDSALLLDAKRADGLVVSPVSYVELAPMLPGWIFFSLGSGL